MKVLRIAFAFCMSLALQVKAQHYTPLDESATKETKKLYQSLNKIAQSGKYLFGHQDALAYGVKWRYQKGRSDIKDVTGDYPALYGWDMGGIELSTTNNLDILPFNTIKKFIKEGYARGGVITLSWHSSNPLNRKSTWDTTHGSVASILPGAANHKLFKSWLDKVAAFICSLKDRNNKPIPVLFRPYHELTGNWFWWCKNTCTPEEFKTLWRFTVDYFNKEKKLHNIVWVYNTSDAIDTEEQFMERYPGDEYVDVLSFDQYQFDDPATSDKFVNEVNAKLKMVGGIARQKKKLFALAETGYEAIPYDKWWTNTLAKAIGDNEIAYVLVWRNHGYHTGMKKMHYYAPYKGEHSAADFVEYYKQSQTIFQKELSKMNIYK